MLSDFHCNENDGFRVVPVHPGLVTSDYGVYEVRGHSLWSPACPECMVTTRKPNHSVIFSYNENPTRALNTISPDAISMREKIPARV